VTEHLNELNRKVQQAEWVGVVGSPSSSNSMVADLIEGAYERGLVGNFCVTEFRQDGKPVYALGQILSISLENPYIERHSVRKITSVRGHAPPLTERHDVRGMEIMIGSAYSFDRDKIIPVSVSSVPPTGTKIFLLNQEIVDELVREQPDISYLGKLYNTNIYLPMFFKHFGKDGGLGEGYHIGIFGKTGSGKSYLAKMLLAIYARFPQMSIIVLDPVGEFSREVRGKRTLVDLLNKVGRTPEVYGIPDICLTDSTSFLRILLRSRFLHELGVIAEENKLNALSLIEAFLTRPAAHPPIVHGVSTVYGSVAINQQAAFDQLMQHLDRNVDRIYVSADGQIRVRDRIANNRPVLYSIWKSIADLFVSAPGRVKIDDLIQKICQQKCVVIVDLSETAAAGIFWSPEVVAIILTEIFMKLREVAEDLYRKEILLNLLVMVDEAHRYIPAERPLDEDFRNLKGILVASARETRKYGFGWLFVSTSVAGLDMEVLKQMRICFFGYGLSWGGELRAMRDLIGEGAYLDLYQSFKDPTTLLTMGGKQYPFMVYGPISPLAISGAPIFFNALDFYADFPSVYPTRASR
jgi:energy-coupling factor transporter ATP-binding protein EcfA2